MLVALSYFLAAGVADHWNRGAKISSGLTAWDGAFYRVIAQYGYAALPKDGLRFFPLYPLLGRWLGALLGGNYGLALLVISNVAALVAAVLVRRLVLFERHDEALAGRAVWITCLFPASFVLVWAYAEGLFLVFAVGTFLAARSRRFGLAAVCVFAAGLTRPVGILLAAPLAVEAWISWRATSQRSLGDVLLRLVAIAAPVLGVGAYLAWVGRTFGDTFAPFSVQTKLRGSSDPFTRLVRAIGDMFGGQRFADGLHTPFVLLFLALLVVVARRWPVSYTVFAGLSLAVALSAAEPELDRALRVERLPPAARPGRHHGHGVARAAGAGGLRERPGEPERAGVAADLRALTAVACEV